MRGVASHLPFRKGVADRRKGAQGSVLLEWALAAALGAMFATAVLAALVGFRHHTSTVTETAQLRADAAIALRFLRHHMVRAADPAMPGRQRAGRIECDTGGHGPVSMWRGSDVAFGRFPVRGGPDLDRSTRRSHCDLTANQGRLAIDYPSDRDASWRDGSNRPADCQGTSLSARNTKKGAPPPQGESMMRAVLWIKVSRDDVTPALFCRGSPDVDRYNDSQSANAIVDGVERLALWRSGSHDEVCIVMRGRIRRAPTQMRYRQPSGFQKGDGSAATNHALRGERDAGDRCDKALNERGHYASRTDYVATDGYRRHVIRAFWPAPSQ